MAKEIEIFQIDAFTWEAFLGNPAGVTFSNDLSEDEMKLIAKEINLLTINFAGLLQQKRLICAVMQLSHLCIIFLKKVKYHKSKILNLKHAQVLSIAP